ncbi:MAG: LacI family DNA-binding transcriptional regulator [Mucilaginibacter sp.]|nr:LacI family DNA-binding transcriptional regulator [Mucilaginibacter sp.]
MGAITIKILAEKLNLSTATISKALSDSHEISVGTKQRVLQLARELNYTPNVYAGSLRRHKSKTIAVVIPEIADSFFSLALNGIEEVALANSYHTLIYLTHEKLEREKAILKELAGGRVDGALVSVTAETDSVEHLYEFNSQLPLVFFDRVCPEIDTAQITTNDFESGYLATKHLIDAGCRKIALLSISNKLNIISERVRGFKKAIVDHNLNDAGSCVVECDENPDRNHQLISELMQRVDRPDGIVATVEKLTTEIYLVCHDLGLTMPNAVKVVCFSNQPSATIFNPSLTTINQPAFEMGKAVALALIKFLKNSSISLPDESIEIPSKLIVRRSSSN